MGACTIFTRNIFPVVINDRGEVQHSPGNNVQSDITNLDITGIIV